MASQESSMPFIRNMASSALDSLRTFLSSKAISTNLSTLDTLKLWKGLFYALWMCDRPLPQQQLCTDLSELIWVLPADGDDDAVPRWLRAFWATMAREWTTGIDVLRMEKFLLLVRRMLGASLVWMQVREETKKTNNKKRTASGKSKNASTTTTAAESGVVRYDAQRVEVVLTLLADWPFRPDEESRREDEEDDLMPKTVPVGLKLHALDIWVDEAEKAGLLLADDDEEKAGAGDEEAEEEKKKTRKSTRTKKTEKKKDDSSLSGREVLERINDLVDTLNSQTLSKAVRIRSKESLADDRLPWNEKEEGAEKDDGEWGGLDD
ncbi:hypothetical protein N0V82_010792 [Gnomoniopsis sp. IMI 355080]|nr:hypothetical protein N0V82_010792 [Gnomoniopsis sp. IMI 355080]